MEQEEYLKYAKKQLNIVRLIAVMTAGIFIVIFLSAMELVPKAASTLEQADRVIADLEEVTADLEEADIPGLIQHTDALIVESGEGIQEALEKLNAMDIETLNEAIGDLQAIVEPLARFFGR